MRRTLAIQVLVLQMLVLQLLLGSGCASYYESSADRDGARIQAEKLAEVEQFRRLELLDPRSLEPSEAESAQNLEISDPMTLDDAIVVATERNRDYQAARERLFISALDLGLTRRDFLRPVFDASANWNLTDGSELNYGDVTGLSFGGSYLFYTGANIRLDTSLSMSNDAGLIGPDQLTVGQARVSIAQPLLQGAGHAIAFEGLTQAERTLLYEARDFETFRQTFVINVINDYYDLLSQKKQLENTRRNIVAQTFAKEQAEALFSIGRGDKLSVFRAEQSLFTAQNALLSAEQGYRVAFDRFKVTQLGVPIALEFEIEDSFPEVNELTLDLAPAIEAALHNRLDLETVRDQVDDQVRRLAIARDALLPNFSLTASYTKNSDAETTLVGLDFHEEVASVGLALEIPLDRKPQRNAYRAALISVDQARRGLERSEDEVVLDVRSSLGSLAQRKAQIEIGILEIQSVQLSVEKAQLEVEQGSGQNRDLTEALDSLTESENQQLDRIVAHEIARLTLLRQLGLLFVEESGRLEK